jgi:N-acetylneuraminic acid mutarotase
MRPSIFQIVGLSLLAVLARDTGATAATGDARSQRLLDQRAVEAVYWNHRLWPEANPTPKPPLEQILPDARILERLEDTARKSAALGILWRRPLTAEQLQEELNRIASGTKDPAMLRELFAALGNDPARIAATLAAPSLADRLVRSWYAMDGSFHAGTRRRAGDDAARVTSVGSLRKTGGVYREIEYVLDRDAQAGREDVSGSVVPVAAQDWTHLLATLASGFDPVTGTDALAPGSLGVLREDAEGFTLSGVLSRGSERIRIATVTWPKRSFDDWWKETRSRFAADPPAVSGHFNLPALAPECVNDTWRSLRTEFPYGRSGHSAVWTGSEMIVWGGRSRIGLLKTGYRYQPATDTFTPIRADDTAPSPRYGHAAVWTGTSLIVWGGSVTLNDTPSNTGGLYDPAADAWRPTRADATAVSTRSGFAAAWTGSELFIWGGLTSSYLQTGGLYNPASDTWRPTGIGAGVPEARSGASAVWTGSEVIVWGGFKQGFNSGLHQSVETGGRYNPTTNLWVPIAGGGPRNNHTAVWTGGSMIVWGGGLYQTITIFPPQERLNILNTGAIYVPASNTWQPTRADTTTPAARQGHTSVWTGTTMIVWGGFTNSGGIYNPSTDTWTATRLDVTTPSARRAHTAVWSGSEMLVWGGNFGTDNTNTATGGRYDPVSDTWVPTHYEPIVPGSSGSPDAPAVWTGSEMVLIGPDPLGRYDPATDQWSSMAVNPPGTVRSGLCVWSGTEVLEYGLQSPGARYNPTTDSWTLMTTNGAPAAQEAATAVWSGREMIVWGGYTQADCCSNPQFVSTGGRYDPGADSWTPTRADGTAPQGRYLHTAVWTGSEMIVWGGQNPNIFPFQINTGGRYHPLTDTWAPTSVTAATPAGRESHSAVWSGSEMIVWGGILGGGGGLRTNSGGAYSPATDQWRPIAIDAATPSARTQHAAQWTGHDMIIWGGNPNNSALSSGGRYDPVADAWTSTRDDATTPIARADFANVWTGRELLAWGGSTPLGTSANTGGGYCACLGPTMTWYRDADGDGHGSASQSLVSCVPQAGYVNDGTDCDDANGTAWGTPGEATDLMFTTAVNLAWNPPAVPGGTAPAYDLLRSSNPSDFVAAATCAASGGTGTGAIDPDVPPPGTAWNYLVRASNGCPSGEGNLGTRSDGTPRVGRACP